jgi:hypothetical protein
MILNIRLHIFRVFNRRIDRISQVLTSEKFLRYSQYITFDIKFTYWQAMLARGAVLDNCYDAWDSGFQKIQPDGGQESRNPELRSSFAEQDYRFGKLRINSTLITFDTC